MAVKTFPEIFKFGIYLLFPVATLFLFNRPEYLAFFKQPSIDSIREGIDKEREGLNSKLPTDLEEISRKLQNDVEFHSLGEYSHSSQPLTLNDGLLEGGKKSEHVNSNSNGKGKVLLDEHLQYLLGNLHSISKEIVNSKPNGLNARFHSNLASKVDGVESARDKLDFDSSRSKSKIASADDKLTGNLPIYKEGESSTGDNVRFNLDSGSHSKLDAGGIDTASHSNLDAGKIDTGSPSNIDSGSHSDLDAGIIDTGSHSNLDAGNIDTGSHTNLGDGSHSDLDAGNTDTGSHSNIDSGSHSDLDAGIIDTGSHSNLDAGSHSDLDFGQNQWELRQSNVEVKKLQDGASNENSGTADQNHDVIEQSNVHTASHYNHDESDKSNDEEQSTDDYRSNSNNEIAGHPHNQEVRDHQPSLGDSIQLNSDYGSTHKPYKHLDSNLQPQTAESGGSMSVESGNGQSATTLDENRDKKQTKNIKDSDSDALQNGVNRKSLEDVSIQKSSEPDETVGANRDTSKTQSDASPHSVQIVNQQNTNTSPETLETDSLKEQKTTKRDLSLDYSPTDLDSDFGE